MRWIITPRDSLELACQRQSYCNLVKRAAAATAGLRDTAWLRETLSALELKAQDFAADLAALQSGATPPRLAGAWPDPGPLCVQEFDDDLLSPLD